MLCPLHPQKWFINLVTEQIQTDRSDVQANVTVLVCERQKDCRGTTSPLHFVSRPMDRRLAPVNSICPGAPAGRMNLFRRSKHPRECERRCSARRLDEGPLFHNWSLVPARERSLWVEKRGLYQGQERRRGVHKVAKRRS
ncbi:uncharacterized protein LOC117229363 [Megalopta genalis]|uniref:uncharacterized protein LOC117229363 n=1 Tax=Megalopta genalis TaxID=115081 RepID=UPI003FD4AA92